MKRTFILIALVSIMSLSLQGQSMKATIAKGVDLTKYETFTVLKGEFMTPPDERKINEQALFQSVKDVVIREMELRGYKFSEDSAQLIVSYVAGAYNVTDGGAMGPLSQAPASNAAEMNQSRSWSHESREGMLSIDIVDTRNKKQVWSATGSLTLDGVDINRAVDASIYKAFKKFPNKNKKKKK